MIKFGCSLAIIKFQELLALEKKGFLAPKKKYLKIIYKNPPGPPQLKIPDTKEKELLAADSKTVVKNWCVRQTNTATE